MKRIKMAIRIHCTPVGAGIDYYKKVVNISEKDRQMIKDFFGLGYVFYTKIKPWHYRQSGYKVIIYNPDRYEFYHREPTAEQLAAIERKK